MSDDLNRRDRLVASWAASLKASGIQFSQETLQRITANDLRMVDRAKADGRLGPAKRTKRKERKRDVARPHLHAEAQADKIGGTFFAREVKSLLDAPAVADVKGVDAERLYAMERRIKALSARGEGRIKSNQTFDKGPWLYPAFAREIGLTCLAFNMRLGGYRELSPRDRSRRFYRALQDICDRSTGLLGPWWVK